MIAAALRLIAAFAVAFASAAFSLWWLGTSWGSRVLAVATFLITFGSMIAPRHHAAHRAAYREEDDDDHPAA